MLQNHQLYLHVNQHTEHNALNSFSRDILSFEGTIEYDQFGIKVAIAKADRDEWTIAITLFTLIFATNVLAIVAIILVIAIVVIIDWDIIAAQDQPLPHKQMVQFIQNLSQHGSLVPNRQ